MRTIITTVGTSLLSNAKRDLGTKQPSEQQISNYLHHTNAVKASAETNSLSRLLKPDDAIVFLHSQTEDGKQCAQGLKHYYDDKHAVTLTEIRDLSYTESRFKMRGLRSLVGSLVDLIRKERKLGREVAINATGGFKAEIAYATLVGLLFDIPVYYIHEVFQDIIEMPPTPIGWDYTLLFDNEDFLEWVFAEDHLIADVDQRLNGRPAELRLLLTEEEGRTILSPAGVAFYESFLERIEKAGDIQVELSDSARHTLDGASADIKRLFERTIDKLRLRELRLTGSDYVGSCDCLVFPKGHRTERLFYYEGQDGIVRVCELARHSDQTYERLIKRGVNRSDYTTFAPWQGV